MLCRKMNKTFLKLIFAIFLPNLCLAAAEIQDINAEFRYGAFFHTSKRFREIYGNVGASYQLEASTHVYNCLDGWVNLDWFNDHGKPEKCNGNTTVNIANVSLGLKYPYCFCEKYIAYIGIGPSIGRIWLKNKSRCEHEKISKLAIGGLLKTGIYCFITCNIFVDLFIDYLYQPVHFEKDVDIGGIKPGIGIGIQF